MRTLPEGAVSLKTDSDTPEQNPAAVTMASFYIVLEVTDNGHTLYPTPYTSFTDALAAIKARWIAFLEENAAVNDTSAELLWNEAVADVTSQNGVVSMYLEKGNNFEIHHMTLP